MAYREFTDSRGNVWRVWSTVPTTASGLSGGFARGWLTFNSGERLRRLAPIPTDWEEVSAQRLEMLCAEAQDVARRIQTSLRAEEAERDEPRTS